MKATVRQGSLAILHGCPFWLRREFAGAEYPRAVAAYAAAFARRYRHLVRWYTPLNEPLVNTLMCGKRGLWPPYRRGDGGYVRVVLQLAAGSINTVEALKQADPDAIMVHVEAASLSRAARAGLDALAFEPGLRARFPVLLGARSDLREWPLLYVLQRGQRGAHGDPRGRSPSRPVPRQRTAPGR